MVTAEISIDNDLPIDNARLVKKLIDRNSPFKTIIINIFNIVKPVLATEIPKTFGNYTIHDSNHSIRIMEYMYDLIEDTDKLSDLELSLLILAALLHDYGMVVTDEEKDLIRSNKYPDTSIKYSALLSLKNNNEYFAIQEYIRRIHGKRVNEKIESEFLSYFDTPGQPHFNFAKELGFICQSHTEDFFWIRQNLLPGIQVKGNYPFNLRFCAYLLRLGDILDIDNRRAPLSLYRLIKPADVSDDEWRQHFLINNYKKIVFDKEKNQKKVILNGKSSDPNIHRKILIYIGWINNELANSITALKNDEEQYRLNLENNVDVQIQTEGYKFSDEKLQLNFKAISNLLMGEKIYGDKTLGLRELIQNSIDACLVRREIYNEQKKFEDEDFVPTIKIIIDHKNQTATVKDNGIGMTYEILKKYFLSIGASYYTSEEFLLKGLNYQPIGNFGIGFLACFMLSDKVILKTRHANHSIKYVLEFFREDEFIIWHEEEDLNFYGTEVIFNLKSFLSVFQSKNQNLLQFLEEYFLTDSVKIEYIETENKTKFDIVNSVEIITTKGGLTNPQKEAHLKIDLSKYLKQTEGVGFLEKRKSYLNQLGDLDYQGTPLFVTARN